jgi:hypothetical protein
MAALDHSIHLAEGTIMAAIIPQQPVAHPPIAAASPTPAIDEVRHILATDASIRLEQLDALDPDQLTAGMAWLAGFNPAVFDATLDAALTVDDDRNTQDEEDEEDAEPYCTDCGATVGIFLRYGTDWRHFRSDRTVAKAEVYETDHAPVVGWRHTAQILK